MQIAIVLYPSLTALDAIGPYDMLKGIKGSTVRFVGHKVGPVPNDRGVLMLGVTHTFEETMQPDIVLVPGSANATLIAAADKRLTDWLVAVYPTAQYITSVCSGSIVLASAGLLTKQPATTHWAVMDALSKFGAIPRPKERIVKAGKVWTAAGVSAGLDLSLALIEKIDGQAAAECIQLMIEYDPQPSLNSGHIDKASNATIETSRESLRIEARNPFNTLAVAKLLWRKMMRRARRRSSYVDGRVGW